MGCSHVDDCIQSALEVCTESQQGSSKSKHCMNIVPAIKLYIVYLDMNECKDKLSAETTTAMKITNYSGQKNVAMTYRAHTIQTVLFSQVLV